jgi:hypothetical protein
MWIAVILDYIQPVPADYCYNYYVHRFYEYCE